MLTKASRAEEEKAEASTHGEAMLTPYHDLAASNGTSPTLQILFFQRPTTGHFFTFTVRLGGALSDTQYVISSFHHTDIDYPQQTITVTTDAAGDASARVRSRCRVGDTLSGTVFAQLTQNSALQAASNHLECPSLQTIDGFGSYLASDPSNNDSIYRPSPPGPDRVRIWVRDGDRREGLSGTIRIQSAQAQYWREEEPLVDVGEGDYAYTWSISGLPQADDYRVQLTLRDGASGLSGVDAFIKLQGRATWVWGKAAGNENPVIRAILGNEDYDGNGVGERDEWLGFSQAPNGQPDPFATTSYFSVYPYINYSGTLVTSTWQSFLVAAHITGQVRIEALAGTHEWVESDAGLQDGKDLCDGILSFNRAGITPDERFDGIHYDVEHDDWYTGSHWSRYLTLITYCQNQVTAYNQTHEPIVFGVDVPPHFATGPQSSGEIKSGWDVLNVVDYITLMDYRDFADVRWDGNPDGIIPRAEGFVSDGNALGKAVIIGVELTPNRYDHVTFFEECPTTMERELREVSRYFAGDWAYKGIAIHNYATWRSKDCSVIINGPTRGTVDSPYTFTASLHPTTTAPPITYVWHATSQSPMTRSAGSSHTVSFTWAVPGPKVLTVTAANAEGTFTDKHDITIWRSIVFLPVMWKSEPQ